MKDSENDEPVVATAASAVATATATAALASSQQEQSILHEQLRSNNPDLTEALSSSSSSAPANDEQANALVAHLKRMHQDETDQLKVSSPYV
jgi:hypothetical protein